MAKAIAVFADGTGNSAAKVFKTNVWRLYHALDTTEPDPNTVPRQIAYYHDGVGTSTFKPLAILGGVFGWGLKRNVLDLYTFLCRNWEPGDRIYAFGFSRGAFTVRLLAGMVVREGIVAKTSEEDLATYARDAYRQFRRQFNPTGGLVTPLRNLRDALINRWRQLTGRNTYAERQADPGRANHAAAVEFVGVWDTVAAYGMPIAEVTRGIDDWIWPLSMPNYALSPKVKRGRHALALDDERDTFHPLIWDERGETDPDHVVQVWFAGMHSDVGGGYADDSLSYVSLDWMLTEASCAQLRFLEVAVAEIRRRLNANGALHDSRRGLGAYYRYQPRKISARIGPPDPTTLLMQDPDPTTRALLREVKIHNSVFQRIQHGSDRYAPIVLPEAYTIVSSGGGAPRPPDERAAARRATDQEAVWDRVWHKRVNYFATVALSAYLALLPLWHLMSPPSACVGPQCLLAQVIHAAGALLPGLAQPWIEAFAATPGRAIVGLLIIVVLLRRSRRLETRSRDHMRALWEESLGLPRATTVPPPTRGWVRRLRSHPRYQRFFQSLKWAALPAVLGVTLLTASIVLMAAALGMSVLRAGIWMAEYSNVWCQGGHGDGFTTSTRCWPLPQTVQAGARYRLTVTVKEPWVDRTIDTTVGGFGPARMSVLGNIMAPLRRSLSAQWFQPMVKIVSLEGGFAIVPLDMERVDAPEPRYTAQFTAPRTGRLYFFVNDVLLPSWVWQAETSYRNNTGSATISLEPVVPPPLAGPGPAGSLRSPSLNSAAREITVGGGGAAPRPWALPIQPSPERSDP